MSNKQKVFCINNLNFSYNNKVAVCVDSLDIYEGEAVAFVGPNGSGKTTCLKLMNGLLGPYSGNILFYNKDIRHKSELRSKSIYVHQHPVLFAGTVFDNFMLALKLKKIEKTIAENLIIENAKRFDLSELLNREASQLSGGETQRISIARAITCGVNVLLLDEPTSSLDSKSEDSIQNMLQELHNSGHTIVFSAHNKEFVSNNAKRIINFDKGKLQNE